MVKKKNNLDDLLKEIKDNSFNFKVEEIESSDILSEENIQLGKIKGEIRKLEKKEKFLKKIHAINIWIFILFFVVGGVAMIILFFVFIFFFSEFSQIPGYELSSYMEQYWYSLEMGIFWRILIIWGLIVVSSFIVGLFVYPEYSIEKKKRNLKRKKRNLEHSIERIKRELKSEITKKRVLDLIEEGGIKFNERDFSNALKVFERAHEILRTSPSPQEIQNILESKIRLVQEKLNELKIREINPIIEQGNLLKNQKLKDKAIEVFKKALEITNNLFKSPERDQKIKEIKSLIDTIYLNKIKEINAKGNQLRKQMKFDESIKTFNKGLNLVKKMYNSSKKNNEISKLKSLINQSKIAKIKNTILKLGTKFGRLQIIEISEECGEDEGLIISIVKEMIEDNEIYAKYFESSKSVAFDQQANIEEIDKLMEQYKQWEEEGISKK